MCASQQLCRAGGGSSQRRPLQLPKLVVAVVGVTCRPALGSTMDSCAASTRSNILSRDQRGCSLCAYDSAAVQNRRRQQLRSVLRSGLSLSDQLAVCCGPPIRTLSAARCLPKEHYLKILFENGGDRSPSGRFSRPTRMPCRLPSVPQLVMYLHSALKWALLGMQAWQTCCMSLMLHCRRTLQAAVRG